MQISDKKEKVNLWASYNFNTICSEGQLAYLASPHMEILADHHSTLKLSDAENRPILLLYVQNLVTLYFDPPFFFGQYFSTSASSSSISETLAFGWFRKQAPG